MPATVEPSPALAPAWVADGSLGRVIQHRHGWADSVWRGFLDRGAAVAGFAAIHHRHLSFAHHALGTAGALPDHGDRLPVVIGRKTATRRESKQPPAPAAGVLPLATPASGSVPVSDPMPPVLPGADADLMLAPRPAALLPAATDVAPAARHAALRQSAKLGGSARPTAAATQSREPSELHASSANTEAAEGGDAVVPGIVHLGAQVASDDGRVADAGSLVAATDAPGGQAILASAGVATPASSAIQRGMSKNAEPRLPNSTLRPTITSSAPRGGMGKLAEPQLLASPPDLALIPIVRAAPAGAAGVPSSSTPSAMAQGPSSAAPSAHPTAFAMSMLPAAGCAFQPALAVDEAAATVDTPASHSSNATPLPGASTRVAHRSAAMLTSSQSSAMQPETSVPPALDRLLVPDSVGPSAPVPLVPVRWPMQRAAGSAPAPTAAPENVADTHAGVHANTHADTHANAHKDALASQRGLPPLIQKHSGAAAMPFAKPRMAERSADATLATASRAADPLQPASDFALVIDPGFATPVQAGLPLLHAPHGVHQPALLMGASVDALQILPGGNVRPALTVAVAAAAEPDSLARQAFQPGAATAGEIPATALRQGSLAVPSGEWHSDAELPLAVPMRIPMAGSGTRARAPLVDFAATDGAEAIPPARGEPPTAGAAVLPTAAAPVAAALRADGHEVVARAALHPWLMAAPAERGGGEPGTVVTARRAAAPDAQGIPTAIHTVGAVVAAADTTQCFRLTAALGAAWLGSTPNEATSMAVPSNARMTALRSQARTRSNAAVMDAETAAGGLAAAMPLAGTGLSSQAAPMVGRARPLGAEAGAPLPQAGILWLSAQRVSGEMSSMPAYPAEGSVAADDAAAPALSAPSSSAAALTVARDVASGRAQPPFVARALPHQAPPPPVLAHVQRPSPLQTQLQSQAALPTAAMNWAGQSADSATGAIPMGSDSLSAAATAAPASPTAGAGADLDELVERAMQALMRRLEIESERRGFTRWA